MSTTTLVQTELPYLDLGKGPGRTTIEAAMKATGGKIARQVYKVPFDKVFIRDGFNVRDDLGDINALADDIEANGLNVPLTLDLVSEENIWYVEMGHRRYAAIKRIRERLGVAAFGELQLPGLNSGMVEAFVNMSQVDELVRITRLFSSNHHEPLKPLEVSRVCQRLSIYYNMSAVQISKQLGLSRQTVDNYLIIAGQPDDIKEAIKSGVMTVTAAVDLARKVKDSSKRSEMVQEAKETARKITVKDVAKIEMPKEIPATIAFQGEDEGVEEDEELPDVVNMMQATSRRREAFQQLVGALKQSGSTVGGSVSVETFVAQAQDAKDEVGLCQRVIGNLDKIYAILAKVELHQVKLDINQLLEWSQKDMETILKFVKTARK